MFVLVNALTCSMGCAPSYPITRSPIIYEPNAYFNITGKKSQTYAFYISLPLGPDDYNIS